MRGTWFGRVSAGLVALLLLAVSSGCSSPAANGSGAAGGGESGASSSTGGTGAGSSATDDSASAGRAVRDPDWDRYERTGHILDARSVRYLERTMQSDETNMLAAYGPWPSYGFDKHGGRQATAVRNQDNAVWRAGSYRLTAYCMGSGSFTVDFSIGKTSRSGILQCTSDDDMSMLSFDVDTQREEKESVVQVTPADGTRAEAAYRVDSVSR